jgi:hypothetical protein
MTEAEDEYERERQENIRKNQELLLSLGLTVSATSLRSPLLVLTSVLQTNQVRVNKRETKRRRDAEQRDSDEASSGSSSDSSPRVSARLSSRPRKSYGTAPKKVKVVRPVIEGTRKSARLSDPTSLRRRTNDLNDSVLIEPLSRRAPVSTLKRIKNPLPLPRTIDDEDVEKVYARAPLPTRDSKGNIIFENNNRHFQPNVTPEEMLRGGIFGGTAFRPFYSIVLGQPLSAQADLDEFPAEWYSGLKMRKMLMSQEYDPEVNRFGVKSGQTLEEWEQAGWIRRQDPRGWWQWYFRFYLGRRTSDDARQISRWQKACGPSGRFKRSLVTKIHNAGTTYDDETISPVVRQTLFHWAYALTLADYNAYLP